MTTFAQDVLARAEATPSAPALREAGTPGGGGAQPAGPGPAEPGPAARATARGPGPASGGPASGGPASGGATSGGGPQAGAADGSALPAPSLPASAPFPVASVPSLPASVPRVVGYAELVDRATELAGELRAATPVGSLVALEVSGGLAGATALLAGALAERALLVLDQTQPPARRALVTEDARPCALLAEVTPGRLGLSPLPEASEPRLGLERVAYVMYTSGSTGRPKGVAVSHRALRDRLRALARVPGLRAGETMLAMTSPSFDISLAELLLPLTVGATVLVAPPATRTDPTLLAGLLADHPVDVLQATPSFWRLALAAGWPGAPEARLWCGGEALTGSLAAALQPHCAELWNLYGPTEATIWALAARIGPDRPVTLGHPLPGAAVALDPPGEGELLLHGEAIAEGYLDRPELTERQFITWPTPDGPRRAYRTGDRARELPDGTYEFLGRIDDQVKIRGHRIELGEVEAVLEAHPRVHQAVALLHHPEDPARTHLELLYTQAEATPEAPDAPDAPAARELRAWATGRLPAAAVPRRYTRTEAFPRTPAGKIDRALLRAAAPTATGEAR
ncbi:thioester reductase [Kitasatospora sp. MMS16-BH015]|uniref:AMP-binding protein n=1 Tax=Kitasatospora sp. MMS16-BH015 TaxID=2018025 RepID=UPI000CA210DF|nr:AMP-binding protein [Kitasatospora sp. MMS16-BH015]AUG80542.1 thioester reductase [Kitasatospora sp. MMS16-BH015]